VTSSDSSGTGIYSLSLLGGSAPHLETGTAIEGELTTAVTFQRYILEGEAGKTYVIQADSTAFNPFINIYQLGSYDYPYYTDDDSGLGTNALAGPYTLSEDMDMVIEVMPVSGSGGGGGSGTSGTGAYTLKMVEVTREPITCDSTTSGTISPNGVYYQFDYLLGSSLNIKVESEADTSLGLYNDFYNMGVDDDSGSGFNPELLNFNFRENYTYTIAVFPSTSKETGDFELSVECVPPTPLTLDVPATIAIDEKHTNAVVIMEDVVAGQGYGITFTADSYLPTYSYLDVYINGLYYTGIYFDATTWGTEIDLVASADGTFTFYLVGEYPSPVNLEFSIVEKEIEAAG
jgi:hypothetical protein